VFNEFLFLPKSSTAEITDNTWTTFIGFRRAYDLFSRAWSIYQVIEIFITL
jgi:hypothetical protein